MNDPRVAKKIAEDFIPVSGGIERLQPSRYGNNESISSRWFQPMAKTALKEFTSPEWWEKFQTYQGLYVVGPDAQVYDYHVAWQLPADKYLGILDQALVKYSQSPPKPVTLHSEVSGQSPSPAPDPGTTVLRVISRIRPLPADCDESNGGIGRDHMWIFDDEVQELMAAAKRADGSRFELPRRIIGRFVRFQLLDTVRNTSAAFSKEEVKTASFQVQARPDSDGTHFSFAGRYDSEGVNENNGEPFGIRGWLQGEFSVHVVESRIDYFRAYGEAIASGRNNAGAPENDYPIVFAIVDAYDGISEAVPPLYHDISPVWRPIYRNPEIPVD